MLTTEQATKLVDGFVALIQVNTTTTVDDFTIEVAEAKRKCVAEARDQLIAAMTGSSRIERVVDPEVDTQLVEAINPEAAAKKELIEAKLVMLDDLLVRHRRLHETLVHYVGCVPTKLHLRSRDLLYMTVDIGKLMRVAGGPWLDVIDQIDTDEKDRQAQTKFAARSTENLAPEILKAKKIGESTAGQPDATNG